MRRPAWRAAASAAALLLLLSLPAQANHVQSAGGKSVSFDHKTGNEWWVEVLLGGPDAATVAKVEAMDTNGPWTVLPRQSWGAYGASFHIEPGHLVRFRATWPGGAAIESCWFTHPAGAEQCATSFTASFSNVKGNEWWVEAKVTGSQPIAQVDARADGGAWHRLTLRSWGSWAASFHILPGSQVQLRATAGSGQTALSGLYLWPSATPVGAWPVAGSYASYHVSGWGGSPAGDVYTEHEGEVVFRFTSAGAWQATCDLQYHHHSDYDTPMDTYSTVHTVKALAPPAWPTNVTAGQEADHDGVEECGTTQISTQVTGETTFDTRQSGAPATVAAWHGYLDDCGCHAWEALWARHQGLLLYDAFSGLGGGFSATLTDTDAPLR
jgi:hypothetical protein